MEPPTDSERGSPSEVWERAMDSLSDLVFRGGPASLEDRTRALRRYAETDPDAARVLHSVLGAWRSGDASERYEDRGLLAAGGMGAVHRAEDLRLGRGVARKYVLPRAGSDTPDPDRLARFIREARITASLDHPGVAPIYDVDLDPDGRPFFTMCPIEGETLADGLEAARHGDRNWSLHRRIDVLISVCDTVAYAHSKGIVHRDLKPSNVMVGAHGEVRVIDWGLAGYVEGRSAAADLPEVFAALATRPGVASRLLAEPGPGATSDGDVLGTPSYMAPEQGRGAHSELGPTADVYSIGAILYECLGGRPPYADSGSALDTLRRLSTSAPDPLPTRSVPTTLAAICERAMARDPAARYPDAAALADDLTAFRQLRPVSAQDSGPLAGLWLWARRNRGVALAALTLLLAGIGGALVVEDARRHATAQARLASSGMETAGLAIDSMLTRVGDEVLEDLPGASAAQAELYEDALQMLREQLAARPEDSGTRFRVAAAHGRLAAARAGLGEHGEALRHHEQQIEILEQLRGAAADDDEDDDDPAATRRAWIEASIGLAEPLLQRDELDRAAAILERVSVELGTPPWSDTPTAEIAGRLFHGRASLELRRGDDLAAIEALDRSIEAYRSGGQPLAPLARQRLIDVLSFRGMLRARRGDEAARADYAAAEQLIEQVPEEVRSADFGLRLTMVRLRTRESESVGKLGGSYPEMQVPLQQALELAAELRRDYPRRRAASWMLGETLRFAAVCADVQDDLAGAADLYDRCLDVLHPFLMEVPDSVPARTSYAAAATARHGIAYQQGNIPVVAAVPLRRTELPPETGLRMEAATQLARLVTVAGPEYFSQELFRRMRDTALRVAREESARVARGTGDAEQLAGELGNEVWDALRADPGFPK